MSQVTVRLSSSGVVVTVDGKEEDLFAPAPEKVRRYKVFVNDKFAFESSQPVGDRLSAAILSHFPLERISIHDKDTGLVGRIRKSKGELSLVWGV